MRWTPIGLAALMLIAPATAQVGVDAGVAVPDVSLETDLPPVNASVDADIQVTTDAPADVALAGDARHMELQISSTGIVDYRAGDATFLAGVDLGPITAEASGSRLHGTFAQGHLQATDAASAGLRVDADQELETIVRLAPEARAEAESGRLVWLQADGRAGALAVMGNGSIMMEDGALAIRLAPGSTLRFEAQTGPAGDWAAEQRSFADGRLGAELDLQAGRVADEYTVQVSRVRTGNGSVSFTVDSALEHGRVVTVVMDAGSLGADAEMRFDGQPAKRADNASAVHAAADSSVAVYSLTQVDGLLYATVHVPSFSAHDIEFASADHAPSQGAPGVGFVPVGIVVAAVGMARRLRRR